LVFNNSPVEDVIVVVSFTNKQVTEKLSEIAVVWFIVETEGTCVIEVNGEFVGE
jgi:hypothetical protein